MVDVKLAVTTTREYSCTISKAELLRFLNGGEAALSHKMLPSDTEICITVPSGGDYSGDSLDLDDAGGLQVSWRETCRS